MTSRSIRRHKPARAQGQELVEFALVVPVLLLVVFGVLDLGRLYHAAITITNAAREGARFATMPPGDDEGTEAATQAEAQNSRIDLTDPLISEIEIACPEGCEPGKPVRVTVTYQFKLALAWVFPSAQLELVRYAEMMLP